MTSNDPLGKSALFSPPPMEPADDHLDQEPLVGGDHAEGRHALYSAGPRRSGTVVVACSNCLNHTRMTTIEALVRIAFISAWIPGKKYSRWMQCPECERRTWCRVHWTG
ncbi:MAG: hypothetical protein QNJ77_01690 [Acidimicrobiia bacterium]|nr:hypothetical protein [Acidimicrobiia bacterium]